MKKNLVTTTMLSLTVSALTLLTNTSKAQDWVAAQGTVITSRHIEAKDAIINNGFIYTASTKNNASGNYDLFITKTNLSGTLLASYSKDYHNQDDIPVKIKADASGNIFVLATAAYSVTDRDMWLLKLDANLLFSWDRYYHLGDEAATDMQIIGTNIYAVGNSVTLAKGSDIALLKYTNSGVLNASTVFSYGANTNNEIAKEIKTDGTYLYIGGNRDTAVTGQDGLILKYNTSLLLQWKAAYSPSSALSSETFNSLVINGSYLFAGGYTSTASTKTDFLLAKFNKSTGVYLAKTTVNSTVNNEEIKKVETIGTSIYTTGVTEYAVSPSKTKVITTKFSTALVQTAPWPIFYAPGTDSYQCKDMKISASGVVAIAGTTTKTSPTGISYTASFMAFYDPAGVSLWEYQTPNNTGCNTIETTANVIIFYGSGYLDVILAGSTKAWFSTIDCIRTIRIEKFTTLIRPADSGDLGTDQAKVADLSENDFDFVAFPNPAYNELTISAETIINNYSIMDLNGKVLKSDVSNDKKITIDIGKLASGSYLITIENEGSKQTKRFIKL